MRSAPVDQVHGGASFFRQRSVRQSQQEHPLHFPQQGPAEQPHWQAHFGSSQQQAMSGLAFIVHLQRVRESHHRRQNVHAGNERMPATYPIPVRLSSSAS